MMTALDATADGTPQPAIHAERAATVRPLAGDPAILGLPSFIVGSIALGLVLVGLVPATAVGASLPIILAATSAGLVLTGVASSGLPPIGSGRSVRTLRWFLPWLPRRVPRFVQH